MSEYKHGSMDTTQNERTFAGFIKLATWAAITAIITLIFMALVNS